MQTILCVKCNSAFQIDETSLTGEVTSIQCPKCNTKINLKSEQPKSFISCPECNQNIPASAVDCPNCGYPIPKTIHPNEDKEVIQPTSYIICPECKHNNSSTSVNCSNCGYPIQKMFQSNKDQANNAYENAKKCLEDREYEEAQTLILNALDLFPKNELYKELKNRIDLTAESQKNSLTFYNNAVELFEKEDLINAALEAEKAQKLFNDPDYHKLSKTIQEKLDQRKIADKNFAEAIDLFNNQEYDKGLVLIANAVSVFPKNAEYQELKNQLSKAVAEQKYKTAQQYYSEKKFKDCQTTIIECLNLVPEEKKYNDLKSLVESSLHKKAALKIGLILLIVAVITIPTVIYILGSLNHKKDNNAWMMASSTNTISSYGDYLSLYPDGSFSLMAKSKKDSLLAIEEKDWDNALKVNVASEYNAFIQKHPQSSYIKIANEKIQALYTSQDEKSSIIEIIRRYYLADSEKNFSNIADFFEFNIKDYYAKSNVSRDELIQILGDYWGKSDLIQSKSDIDFESMKIDNTGNGGYKVSFKNNYEVLRSDNSKPNHFLTNTYITFNRNLKIESINGDVISKWNAESTLAQTTTDQISSESQGNGSFTDSRDGLVYKTVKIGTQIWMAENLRYKTSSGCWAYNNNQNNVGTYGYLYDWETALKVCPTGWHLPSEDEWTILLDYLGGNNGAGGKLKEAGTSHWQSPNSGATNLSGFTGLPAGIRMDRDFTFLGEETYLWSSSQGDAKHANSRNIYYNHDDVELGFNQKVYGFSVRCIFGSQ